MRERYVWATVAAVGTMLTYAVSGNGLILPAFVAIAQLGLLAGVVAGMVARDVPSAAVASAVGLAGGIALQAAGALPDARTIALTLAIGVAVAAGVRAALGAGAVRESLVTAAAVALIVANLWLTAATLAPLARQGGTEASLFAVLEHRPLKYEDLGDSGFYRNVVWKMKDGATFYPAYRDAWFETWVTPPSSLFAVRQPTIFALWAAAPGWPRSALYVFLVFATAAVAAVPFVSRRAVPVGLTIFGAASVAAYLLRFATEPGLLFLQEEWVGALAVVVFALYALSHDERRHAGLMLAAALLAVLAMMLRELMLYVILGGVAAAFFAKPERRRFDVGVWGAALVVGVAYWGLHAMRANSVFPDRAPDPSSWIGQGAGIFNLLHGLTDFTILLSYHGWVPVALGVLGVAGALAQPDKQYRAFAAVAVLMPLVGFLFVSNGALDTSTYTIRANYWGAIVMPALLALAPSALLLLPGLRRPAPAQATEGEGHGADTEQRMAAGA